MYYLNHLCIIHNFFGGLGTAILVCYRRFLLNNLMQVWYFSDHMNGVFFFNKFVMGEVISAKAGTNDL